ncbi:WecB/TagA/CpsF family glycosyltransferase [Candidatus Epulonipiscium viviparus]|uniref:WecB/TagA/CpsF family glycosyltransferase n=1 Tax=Candidatus Epulonipiscium viviparus TaxID=420336 RepID=UPI00016C0045|nr:WecB/TagA/CpsF family glycosyltransferase [Candidatus Epulopiscium viviparus]
MRKQLNILNVLVDNITMQQAVFAANQFLTKSNRLRLICTPNPEIIMRAKQDKELLAILNSADMVIPDGIGVVIASKILTKNGLRERVAGYDLVQNLMKEGNNRFYFLGGEAGVAKSAARNMKSKYPNMDVVGYCDGYFQPENERSIIRDINASEANILLVGLGSPKQEVFINKHRKRLKNIKVAIGVGGSFDVMAGKVKRAPKIFRQLGLEWFYRLVKEPSRAKRMLKLPVFLFEVIYCKLTINP